MLGNKRTLLLCHIMENDHKEIAVKKSRTYAQEFNWKKRIFPIDYKAIWVDRKGISHLHVQVNEADGTYKFLYQVKDNIQDDKCSACGGKISIDAKNVRDLVKRKTISAIWGLDQSHILIIMIAMIACVILAGALFFVLGQLEQTQTQLQKYLPQPKTSTTILPNGQQTSQFILGEMIFVN